MAKVFVERRPELLALEGWYDVETYKFKLSCRFKDILRCSEFNGKTRHFLSCFRKEGMYREQPWCRCLDPNWAIIYTPDKHGNFLGRTFAWWEQIREGEGRLVLEKIYGNRLNFKDVMIKINIECRVSQRDTYLGTDGP